MARRGRPPRAKPPTGLELVALVQQASSGLYAATRFEAWGDTPTGPKDDPTLAPRVAAEMGRFAAATSEAARVAYAMHQRIPLGYVLRPFE